MMSGEKRGRDSSNDARDESKRSSKQSRTVENEMEKISLPISIDLETFVSSRKDELANLANTVKVKMRKLVSQQLPRHLRRRTVSHNKKRLPRRLQPRFNAEAAKETKRPSRLHRRRPRNLQEDYARRSRENRWLETHIWHAKRFRMVNQFGYRIPDSSFDKSLRACYRGSSKYCLLNDISYYCCIQLRGDQAKISALFGPHTWEATNIRIHSRKYIEGKLQGTLWFYEAGEYPFGAVGEISFLWRPRTPDCNERKLWIWCHPAVRETLLKAFEKTLARFRALKKDGESTEDDVKVEDLRDELNRFRLTGPLAVRTLCETLTQDESGLDVGLRIDPARYNNFWRLLRRNALSASYLLHDGQIVGNLVLDPRLHMPSKRLVPSVVGAAEDEQSCPPLPEEGSIPADSEIWDSDTRRRVKAEMLTQDEINKLRQKNLVPGTPLDLKEKESRIPVLVIFRSGSRDNLGYGRGCDIIVPSGWGRQFFIALNYRGARAAGLRDINSVTRYCDQFVFPDDVPDSAAGEEFLKKETETLRKKHFSYPPDKRPPFFRLGVVKPYAMPFNTLVSRYPTSAATDGPDHDRVYVVRERAKLKILSKTTKGNSFNLAAFEKCIAGKNVEGAFVPVKLVTITKGVPQRFARIYIIPHALAEYVVIDEMKHSPPVPERQCEKQCFDDSVMDPVGDNQFPIVGFVTSGGRNLTGKTATALGYVSVQALHKIMANPDTRGTFAFRNQDVFGYHRVTMQILSEISARS